MLLLFFSDIQVKIAQQLDIIRENDEKIEMLNKEIEKVSNRNAEF